jgi:hypothetical protein
MNPLHKLSLAKSSLYNAPAQGDTGWGKVELTLWFGLQEAGYGKVSTRRGPGVEMTRGQFWASFLWGG